jgi:hypothetical protein
MILSHEAQTVLSFYVAHVENSIRDDRVTHPMGKVFQKKYKISREQVERLMDELRTKILFPQYHENEDRSGNEVGWTE